MQDDQISKGISSALYLYEDSQAVVGIAGSVQVVLILLCDVGHQHVHQRLHSMME